MNKVLESFYKMRDSLIAEGYNYPQCFETMCEVEKSLLALEIIKNNDIIATLDFIQRISQNKEEYNFLKEVLL